MWVKKGGRFRITPTAEEVTHKQLYWPDTNVLVTRFLSPGSVGQITDYMPVGLPEGHDGHGWVLREVHVVRGAMDFHLECRPAFNYIR